MENYADRKRGFDVGLYAAVREQMTPYAKPMECGNHEDVRWAAVGGKDLPALLAAGRRRHDAGFGLAVHRRGHDADRVLRGPARQYQHRVDSGRKTLGVGSNGCGPRPLEQYIVWSEPTTFSYVLRLLPAGEKNLSAAGRVVMPQNRVKPVLAARDKAGLISLSCATPGAKIEYSIDGAEWKTYAEPFELLKGTVQVKAEGKDMISYEGAIVFTEPAAAKWNVTASSFQPDEGEPVNAIDEDPDTFWHSRYSGGVVKHPHFLVIDFKKPLDIAGVTYTARRDMPNGRIKDYEIYFSNDPENWGEPALKGSLPTGPEGRRK